MLWKIFGVSIFLRKNLSLTFDANYTGKRYLKANNKNILKKRDYYEKKGCSMSSVLKEVPHHVGFRFADGHSVQTILSLISKLEQISDEQYTEHVTEYKNDFANWIEHVFEDKKLAQKIRQSRTRHTMIRLLKDEYEFVTEYKNKSFLGEQKSKTNHTPPSESIIEKYTHPVHKDIEQLEEQIEHLTKKDKQDSKPYTDAVTSSNLREKAIDFVFGFVVGLLAGLIIAKSFGLY